MTIFVSLLMTSRLCFGLKSIDEVEDEVVEGQTIHLDNGLVVKIIKRPRQCLREASVGDHITVHYTGRFDDDQGEVFDTSLKPGHPPFKYQLGAGRVIQGYELGTPGICKGETRTLTVDQISSLSSLTHVQVPSSLAYGDHGVPGKIPGKATLHFTVECLLIVEGELPPPPKPQRQNKVTII